MALWKRLFHTDPANTKSFKRGGGFGGTAIDPMSSVERATEEFGPCGRGWGWTEMENKIFEAANGQVIWFSKVLLWYRMGEELHNVGPQWGATELVALRGESKKPWVDEEAAKKAVTDGITKCLSYIGIGADVHMGMFDDNKYVAERKIEERKKRELEAEEERKAKKAAIKKQPDEDPSNGEAEATPGTADNSANNSADNPREDLQRERDEQEPASEEDDPGAQDPNNSRFNPQAWFVRAGDAIRAAKDEEQLRAIWERERVIAAKLSGTKFADLGKKIHELARERMSKIRKAA
jgi:hypothetical protein